MNGEMLKELRVRKGMQANELSDGIMSASKLSKIEKYNRIVDSRDFIKILFKLNMSLEEYYIFSEERYIKERLQAGKVVAEALRLRQNHKYNIAIEKMNSYYEEYKDEYFRHNSCLIKAFYSNKEDIRHHLFPIISHLKSKNEWLFYELTLFNNICLYYPFEEAKMLHEKASNQITKFYQDFKDNEITRSLLINMASHALESNYFIEANKYSNMVIALPQSSKFVYESLFAKIILQISNFKLENGQFSSTYLKGLVDGFKMMDFRELHTNTIEIINRYEVPLE